MFVNGIFRLDKCAAFYYTYSYDNAPSPSGKAGDFDSPIVGSTPAGAIYAGVAQWPELVSCKYRAYMDLAGSNPVSSSISSIILIYSFY